MKKIHLLLIEDDEDDYIITRELLNDIMYDNYTLDWAKNSEIGRNLLAGNEHDVCLLDYSLGAEDGLTILHEAPKLGFKNPIIMLTGQDNEELDREALDAGAVDYLIKSQLNAARLARSIRYAIARREMETSRVERLKAEAENRSKSEFLAHLSHELRTPLTSILGYTDLLAKQSSQSVNNDYLKVIKRNGHHLLSLLNDVLDLSKIEAGKLDIEYQRLELIPFITDIYKLMQVKAQDKNIEFNIAAKDSLPDYISTDPTRLRQILINLLSNAIKFTDTGFVHMDISLLKVKDQSRYKLQFAIKDSGIGIKNEDIEKLFKPFSQATNISTRNDPGTGLGLAISQKLATRLGGGITLQSEHKQGSTFTASIDIGQLDEAVYKELNLAFSDVTSSEVPAIKVDGSILIADDLPDIRELIGHMVSKICDHIEYASNGKEAVEKILSAEQSGKGYDLVLMDMQMPIMNGMEATLYLKKNNFEKPIVALTAATMQGERERCLNAGFTEHLGKPIDEANLIRLVMRLMNDGKNHKKNSQTGKHILLVEDDKDAATVTALLLEGLGWEVTTAENGKAALNLFGEISPTIIFLDINLPDMNGFVLAKKIKESTDYNGHIIAISGHDLTQDLIAESDIDDYQLKPIDLTVIKELLSKYQN